MEYHDSSSSIRNGVAHAHYTTISRPQQHIMEESQLGMNGPWTIHVDSTYALPVPTVGTQQSNFNNMLSDSTPQSRALNDILSPLLRHHDTASFAEVISNYLKLPGNIWQALR